MTSQNILDIHLITSPKFEFDLEKHENGYYPYRIKNLQKYNPVYSLFLENESNENEEIGLNHKYHISNLNTIVNMNTNESIENPVFVKFSPLLDPIRYLIGKYKAQNESLRILPSQLSQYSESSKCHPKLLNLNNASYIDNFFCYLSSQLVNIHQFKHGIDFYGSFLGIQEKFKINIVDDIDYLNQSEHFLNSRNEVYEIDDMDDPFANFGSRKNKNKIDIHNESNVSQISVENLEITEVDSEALDAELEDELMYEKTTSDSDDSSENSSNNSEMNYTSDDDSEEEKEEDEEEEESDQEDSEKESESNSSSEYSEEPTLYAYIKEFPVQMICLEKCQGTLDELFMKDKMDEENASAALFQIIMTLLAYQKAFHFTHNDLHTNNIMYVETDEEFLFYKFDGKMYKVPTYGKIFKIIDFGRAIYKVNGRIYCSDSFGPEGDASTQYNFEPYMNSKKPRLEPNYSFDLCRLGCSIFDFILDEDFMQKELDDLDELQRTIIRWCSDDNGKNMLYRTNGDERYPNFKLYKMIARSVHNHTPSNQLNDPYFSQFLCKEDCIEFSSIIDIDSYPCYA
jgi:hypothetical protein